MIAGKDAPTHGEAKNSWLSGTAAWNYVAISQWILGIRPEHDGLRIDPAVPGGVGHVQGHAAVPRRHVQHHHPEGSRRGRQRSATYRGRPRRPGNLAPLPSKAGQTFEVVAFVE